MTEDHRLSRLSILIDQKKFAEAKKILSDLLTEDPNNTDFLSVLAEINLQQDKVDEAERFIDNAIGLSPDSSHLFYIKSRIALQKNNLSDAEKHIHEALQLEADDADYFALLAHIKLSRKKFSEALEIANQALEIDAENLMALNTRSSALTKLDRKEESFATIEGALREDPNNAYTHANYGWGLLEKGDHKKALEHFKEALKSDPTLDYAQAGMIEALKAANPLYRLFLKYSFWMSNLTAKYQWGVIIGFYLGVKGLNVLARNNEALEPFLTPLIILLALVAFSTWVISPISDTFLRFNKYGQFLLNKQEKMSSNFVAAGLGLSVIGLLFYFGFADERFLSIGVFGFAMVLPFSVMLSPSKNKNLLLIYTIAMAIIGISAIGLTFATGELLNPVSTVFILGFVGFQWLANYLMIRDSNQ